MSSFHLDEDELTLSLLNDITAVCSVGEGRCSEMDSKHWTSEELLSTCALLLKEESAPFSVNASELGSNDIPLCITTSEMGRINDVCPAADESLFDDFNVLSFISNNSLPPNGSSNSLLLSSSTSSSFTSCESVFDVFALSEGASCPYGAKHEDSPLIYHSCSSLTDLDDPLNEAKSAVFLPLMEKPLITSSPNREVRGRAFDGTDVNGSDKGESHRYDSETGNPKEGFFCNLEDDSRDNRESIENSNEKCYKALNEISNSLCKNITLEAHYAKMQHLPSTLKTSLGGGGEVARSGGVNERNVLPSLPGFEAVGFSAKELDDVTRDLFCLPFEEDQITSFCHYLSNSAREEGKKDDENKEGTIKEENPSFSEYCPEGCDNWVTNIVTTSSTASELKNSTLISKILATATANKKTASITPTATKIKTTTTVCEGLSADVEEAYCGFCDYFFYLYFKNYKYFNRDEIICANKKIPTYVNMFIEETTKDDAFRSHRTVVISEGDKNMFLNNLSPKMLFSNPGSDYNKKCCNDDKPKGDTLSDFGVGEVRSSPPEESILSSDYVPCKRLSNLFHAVPVLIEYPDWDSGFRDEGGTLLKGSNSADECYLRDDYTLLNCNNNDAVNRQFSTINSNSGDDHKTNLASNMKSSQCQFFVGTGTVTDSAVSDDFGAVVKHLNVVQIQKCGEDNDLLFIGEITFNVYGKILSYPIFIDVGENKYASGDFPYVSEDAHFSLATGGHDWNLYLDKNELRPVVQVLEDIMADNLNDDNENSSVRQFSTCRLYGFTITSNENSRVKNLIPLFNQKPPPKGTTVPSRRSSISTSVPLRKSVSFANKSHRNSAACDVEMYRNAQEFLPLKEKTGFDSISGDSNFKVHSVVINNPVIDNTPPATSTQHILMDDSGPLPDIKSKEINSSNNLKPPCVLRSKSDSKILSGLNINRETCRSISLNTPEAEGPSNLSRFRGVTLVEDQELCANEIEAKAFLSSFIERSMNSDEKTGRSEPSDLNYRDESPLSPNTTSSNNLKTAMAVSRILSHINNAEEILSNSNTGININPTVSGKDQHPSELFSTSNVQYENTLSLTSNFPLTSVSELSPCERNPSPLDTLGNIYNPNNLTPSTTSLIYTTSGVIFSIASPLPCTSASLISSCCVTNVTPLMTKMSVLPMMKESPFPGDPSFEHSVSSFMDNSDNQYSKSRIEEKSVDKRNQPTKIIRSSSLKSRIENIQMQQEKTSPPPRTKVNRSSSLRSKAGDVGIQQEMPSSPPQRLSYSTKFPMDIICQGRLEEVKRKTAPPGEYSPSADVRDTRSTIWGSRKYSVGQVKPLKENYPTSRSKSAGRMDFGRTSFRKTSPERGSAFKDDTKILVKERHTVPHNLCVSSSVPIGYSNEYESLNTNSLPKHRLSEIIKEEPEGDNLQEINTSCSSRPGHERNLANMSERSLRNNNLLSSYIDNLVSSLVNVRTIFSIMQEHYQNSKRDCSLEIQSQERPLTDKICSQTIIQSALREGPSSAHLDLLSNSSLLKSKTTSFEEDERKGRIAVSVSETYEVGKSPDEDFRKILSPENIGNESQTDFKLNKLSEIVPCTTFESSKNFKISDSPIRYFEASESLPDSTDRDFGTVRSTNMGLRESESPEYFYSTSETPFKHNQEENLSERIHRSSESPDKFYSILETLQDPLNSENSYTSTFPVREFSVGREEDQTESLSNVISTLHMPENIPKKPSDYYINNIQIPQLKSRISPDTEIDKETENVSTSKCTLGGIVKDPLLDRLYTCESIARSPDLCITSSFAGSSFESPKIQNLDISLTNSKDLKISSRKSPDCNIKNFADVMIGREADLITRKSRSPDSHTLGQKKGLCQDFRESPDLVIKSSRPVSDTRTSRSPELDITLRNSPTLSIRSSKSPDVSARTRKSPDLIVSAQKVSEINKNFVKPLDSFKQTRKSPDLLINALKSPNVFQEHPNSYIQEETILFPISRVSPEQTDFTAREPSLSGFEMRMPPETESNNFPWKTIKDTRLASAEIKIPSSLHPPSASKDIHLSENFEEESVHIWETMNLDKKPLKECETKEHEASSLSSLDTRLFVPETNVMKFTPEEGFPNVAIVSGAPLPDVADVGRFSVKSHDVNVALPEIPSPDDIDTVRSFFEVSHHKTVDLEGQSENANTGIILKSEIKIEQISSDFRESELKIEQISSDIHDLPSAESSVSPVDIKNEESDRIQADASVSLLLSTIPSTDFSTIPKRSVSTSSTKDSTWPYVGESEDGTPTKSLSFYVENMMDFIDNEGDGSVDTLHLSRGMSKDSYGIEEPVVTLKKFEMSAEEGENSTGADFGKSSMQDTKEVYEYVSPGTLIPKSSDMSTRILSSTSAGSSCRASHSPEGYPRSSPFEYSEGAGKGLKSVSPSFVGPQVHSPSNQGPVARRDLFPLEDDDEVTPHWHALLEVNAPDSEDDEPMCYDTDEDDFESMDAEMRRLEEKLKKFERELGGAVSSEGEALGENKGTFKSSSKLVVKSTSRERNTSSIGLLRLRQEDIDVLRSFSLPEVYPPVDLLKTKHLSLLKNDEDVLEGDVDVDDDVGPTRKRQRTFSGSNISNGINIEKHRRRGKRGDRRCRSLDAIKFTIEKGSHPSVKKLPPDTIEDQIPVVMTKELPPIVIEDIEKKSEAGCLIDDESMEETSFIDEKEIDEEEESYGSYSLYSESFIGSDLTSSGYLVGEDLCDGVIWKEDLESEFTLFDCYGLESILNHKRPIGKDYLFFIFEDDDDDDDDEVEFYSRGKDSKTSHYVDGTFLLPVSTDSTYSARESPISCEDSIMEDIEHSCRKKRDISLVSAFKNSFRKAAKYLGPVSPSTSPKGKNTGNSPSSEIDGSSGREKESDSCSMSGSYNVRTGQVQGASLNNDEDDDYGSGEFYASPALCILTSDEERVKNPSSARVNDNLKTTQDRVRYNPSSLRHSPSSTPPPVPPRKSVLMQNVADHIEILGRAEKHHHQSLSSDPTFKHSSSPPTPTTFLRNLTKKAKNLVDEKSKEIGHGSTVSSEGRTEHLGRGVGAEGNDKSLSSPRPKVLPEHRTWLTRGK